MLLNLSAVPQPPPPPMVSRVHSKEETEAAHDLLSLSQSLPPHPPQPPQQQRQHPHQQQLQQVEQPPTPPTPPEESELGLKMPQGPSHPTREHEKTSTSRHSGNVGEENGTFSSPVALRYRFEQKTLLSSATHVPSGLMGCLSAALS